MIGDMRTLRRQEAGKPAAALAIIATIFATALVIKLLPPATRQALVQITNRGVPARPLSVWAESPAAASRAELFPATPALLEARPAAISVVPAAAHVITELPMTFESKPPGAPMLLQAETFTLVALPMEVAAEPAGTEIETSTSPLMVPFAKTGSALRFAFVKTGSAIKAAASGTAGVFQDPRP